MRLGRRRIDLLKVWFIGSCVALIFAYGVAVGRYRIFPFEILNFGVYSLLQVREEAGTLFGIRPEQYLSPARYPGDGVTVRHEERMAPGLTLVTGLFDDVEQLRLIEADGTPVRVWPAPVTKLFDRKNHPNPPRRDWNAQIHGALALPDGSVVFNFDYVGTVKLDRCGEVEWTLPIGTHHSIERSEHGGFWIPGRTHEDSVAGFPRSAMGYDEDRILRVSEDGEVLEEIPITRVFVENDLLHLLLLNRSGPAFSPGEIVHLNDIEELPDSLAGRFPDFAAGDLLLSFRDKQLVMVVDPRGWKVKWYQTGPWVRQHDPDFQIDGTITVFNNNNDGTPGSAHLGGSEVVQIDPTTRETRVLYGRRPGQDMYTAFLGKHQVLPNGNILITESLSGRLLEVTPAGKVVWEVINRYDEETVADMAQATRYPPSYFEVDDWTCS